MAYLLACIIYLTIYKVSIRFANQKQLGVHSEPWTWFSTRLIRRRLNNLHKKIQYPQRMQDMVFDDE
jgi:hypothetical protein